MENNYLDKVVDQIVRETEIDYVNESIYFPFLLNLNHRYGQMSTTNLIPFLNLRKTKYYIPFINHCRDIYGLNDEEILYVSDKYKKIINDKLKEQWIRNF